MRRRRRGEKLLGAVVLGPGFQDPLHGAVLGVTDLDGPAAGSLEALGSMALREADDALSGAQVIERPIAQQALDELSHRGDRKSTRLNSSH